VPRYLVFFLLDLYFRISVILFGSGRCSGAALAGGSRCARGRSAQADAAAGACGSALQLLAPGGARSAASAGASAQAGRAPASQAGQRVSQAAQLGTAQAEATAQAGVRPRSPGGLSPRGPTVCIGRQEGSPVRVFDFYFLCFFFPSTC